MNETVPESYIPTDDDMPQNAREQQADDDAELAALRAISAHLSTLFPGAQRRILTYLFDKFVTETPTPTS